VWCHQAHRLEHELDHYTGDTATWHRLIRELRETPELARIAERHIQAPHRNVDPHQWSPYAERATEIHAAVQLSRRVPDHGLDIG
jgi:hypothetical protein